MSASKHRGTGSRRRLAAEAGRSLAKLVPGQSGTAGRRDQDAHPTLLSAGNGAGDPWSALPPPAKPRTRGRS